ncbi:unnamed protein product [Caenorhabditis auriculariae]|uniref:Uncharacterized protein n=1 Tax=Caenorhabditis auriculariae TaxID=2777116 RepID=A0A8S1GPY5_9PELO|nr:unnamed protein product [Caenorhabditis auriculariae]
MSEKAPSPEPAEPRVEPVAREVNKSPSPRCFGTCKWFNVAKGYGFIVDDVTGEDLFVHQTHLNMEGFRSLDEGERVSYYIQARDNGKGREAYGVSSEKEGETLKGSSIRPLGKKRQSTLRCFRCGKFAKHKAKNCPNAGDGKSGKVCYVCGSDEHLSGDCPERPTKSANRQKVAEKGEFLAEESTKGKDLPTGTKAVLSSETP